MENYCLGFFFFFVVFFTYVFPKIVKAISYKAGKATQEDVCM